MTNYNDGKWHGWNGGECPVHPETVVMVTTGNGDMQRDGAIGFDWDCEIVPIIAFRVIKQHREPREVWLAETRAEGWLECTPGYKGATLFREVLE